MKIKLYFCFLLSAFCFSARASTYAVTNDLGVTFTVFDWTNNAGDITNSLSTNLAPTTVTFFSLSTNGIGGLGIQATNAPSPILLNWTNIPLGGTYVSTLFAIAMAQAAPAEETVPQSQTILRSYFLTGATPGEANYWEWIDTMFWYINYMATNEAAAASWAQQAATVFPASAKFTATNGIVSAATNNILIYGSNNVASIYSIHIGSSGGSNFYGVVFLNPLATTNYVLFPSANYTGSGVMLSNTLNGFLFGQNTSDAGKPIAFFIQ